MSLPSIISREIDTTQHLPWKDSRAVTTATHPQETPEKPSEYWGKDGFNFSDLIDIINPLQHIPLVSDLYQELTGDTLSPGARMGGGLLFGGAIGMASSFINQTIQDATGKTIGGHATYAANSLFGNTSTEANNDMLLALQGSADNDTENSYFHARTLDDSRFHIQHHTASTAYRNISSLPSSLPDTKASL